MKGYRILWLSLLSWQGRRWEGGSERGGQRELAGFVKRYGVRGFVRVK